MAELKMQTVYFPTLNAEAELLITRGGTARICSKQWTDEFGHKALIGRLFEARFTTKQPKNWYCERQLEFCGYQFGSTKPTLVFEKTHA